MLAHLQLVLLQAVAVTQPYGPGLADWIQIFGGGGSAFGAFAALLKPTPGPAPSDQMWKNVGIGLTIGGVVGTMVGFAIWAAIRLNGGVG